MMLLMTLFTIPSLGRPRVVPSQRVIARRTGEDAVAKQRVRVGGVDADAVTRRYVLDSTAVRGALGLDVSREFDERVGALAMESERGDDALDGFETFVRLAETDGVRRRRREKEEAPEHAVDLEARRAVEHHARHEEFPLVLP